MSERVTCMRCGSTGWVTDTRSLGGEKPCPDCNGKGVVDG